MNHMISIRFVFMGKEVHVLSEVVTLRSKAMAIAVAIIMFRLPSGGCF